jgi:ABC-type lipoprotein release transport system permease subunit
VDPELGAAGAAGTGPALPGAAIARVRVPVVVRSEREVRGVQLVGTDPGREIAFSFLGSVRTQGIMIRRPGDRGLILGRALARDLDTEPGKRVVLLAQDREGRAVEAGFTVLGLFDAETDAYERAFAFVGRDAAQAFLRLGSRVTEISLRVPPGLPVDEAALAERVRALVAGSAGDGAPLLVRSWKQINPHAAAMVAFSSLGILIWQAILLLALSFGLANTLLASVYERIPEIGLLQALGMSRGSIVAQVVLESLVIVMLGLVLGLCAGVAFVFLLADGIDLSRWAAGTEFFGLGTRLLPELRPADVHAAVLLVLVLAVVGSLYPAWHAARLSPLDALGRRGQDA